MKKIKLPANPIGWLALLVVAGIIANVATEPAARKVGELKGKLIGGNI